MGTRARVIEMPLAQLRRSLGSLPSGATQPGVFSDMTDGAAVMQLFFNLAGFEWKETKIFLPVAELCGAAGRTVSLYDDELAEHARCTDRTVRNWRRDYLARAATVSFHPLEVAEGEYDRDKQRYERTRYTVAEAVAEQIERAVAAARAMPDYATDRMECLERAARVAYDDIPDAPAKKGRKRKPKKSLQPEVIKSLTSAQKGIEKGRRALDELGERRRAALLAGQGEELRDLLLAMRGEIESMLSEISEDAESVEVDDIPENLSGIPPAPDLDSEQDSEQPKNAFREDINTYTRKVPDEPDEPSLSPEAEAVFDGLMRRLTAPKVRSVEIVLREPEEGPPDEAGGYQSGDGRVRGQL